MLYIEFHIGATKPAYEPGTLERSRPLVIPVVPSDYRCECRAGQHFYAISRYRALWASTSFAVWVQPIAPYFVAQMITVCAILSHDHRSQYFGFDEGESCAR